MQSQVNFINGQNCTVTIPLDGMNNITNPEIESASWINRAVSCVTDIPRRLYNSYLADVSYVTDIPRRLYNSYLADVSYVTDIPRRLYNSHLADGRWKVTISFSLIGVPLGILGLSIYDSCTKEDPAVDEMQEHLKPMLPVAAACGAAAAMVFSYPARKVMGACLECCR